MLFEGKKIHNWNWLKAKDQSEAIIKLWFIQQQYLKLLQKYEEFFLQIIIYNFPETYFGEFFTHFIICL